MESKKRAPKESSGLCPQEIESLLSEAEEKAAAWMEDPGQLLQKLLNFSPEGREGFFLNLLQRDEEKLYSLLGAIMGKEDLVDIALANSLGQWASPRAARWLHRLYGGTASKKVTKAIRRAIFRLKSMGLEVQEISDSSPAVYRPPQPAVPEGFLSSIDAVGARMVWWLKPSVIHGSIGFSALISDLRGIVEFVGFETTRKKFHDYLAEFGEDLLWQIVEADPEYCHGLLVEASAIHRQKGLALPEEYLKWEPLLGPPPELPLRPLIYLHLKEEDIRARADLPDRAATLFELPLFQSWFLEEEEVRKYVGPLKEASSSRLVLMAHQKEARLMDIYRQAMGELFDQPRRALFRRRLEEMAYILWKKERRHEAQVCLAAGLGLESEGGVLSPHPFLLELTRRSLVSLLEEELEKEGNRDLIIKP